MIGFVIGLLTGWIGGVFMTCVLMLGSETNDS